MSQQHLSNEISYFLIHISLCRHFRPDLRPCGGGLTVIMVAHELLSARRRAAVHMQASFWVWWVI